MREAYFPLTRGRGGFPDRRSVIRRPVTVAGPAVVLRVPAAPAPPAPLVAVVPAARPGVVRAVAVTVPVAVAVPVTVAVAVPVPVPLAVGPALPGTGLEGVLLVVALRLEG